jgi:hypothetical protein
MRVMGADSGVVGQVALAAAAAAIVDQLQSLSTPQQGNVTAVKGMEFLSRHRRRAL